MNICVNINSIAKLFLNINTHERPINFREQLQSPPVEGFVCTSLTVQRWCKRTQCQFIGICSVSAAYLRMQSSVKTNIQLYEMVRLVYEMVGGRMIHR